jgi:hypothetical protein
MLQTVKILPPGACVCHREESRNAMISKGKMYYDNPLTAMIAGV